MQKLVCLLLTLLFTTVSVSAESLNKTINSLGINKSALSVSIKDVKNGESLFSLNDRTPRLPASTLKLITASAAYDVLGDDYEYKTEMYKSTNNDVYLKLSGDPSLSKSDLEAILETAKSKNIVPKTFYIDDTAFDSVEWGEGWQWDDELNPLMPKFSVYNIDKNLLKIEAATTVQAAPAQLSVKPFYPMSFINQVKSDIKGNNQLSIKRNETIAPNMFEVSGSISRANYITIPALNQKLFFRLRLEEAISKKKFEYYGQFKSEKLPKENVYYVDGVSHKFVELLPSILKSSNNLIAETVFKTAGAKWANSQGTAENSLAMLDDYIQNIGLSANDVKIVDGSGVSKNNIMTTDFMTDFLIYKAKQENFEDFCNMLPTPGEGTLKNRMLYFKENLRAKTGTLSEASAIAGYLTTKRGRLVVFDIMINDANTSAADKKNVEEQILRNIYLNY